MLIRKTLLLAVFFVVPLSGSGQCVPAGGLYEGYLITSVKVESLLSFPVKWIENSLLGGVIKSLDDIAAGLPVKTGKVFHNSDHILALQRLSAQYTDLTEPGARLAVAYVVPRFHCDSAARTVGIVYHVYSTRAMYFASRLLETSQVLPDRTLTIGKASATIGNPLIRPYFGYNHSRRGFAGAKLSWTGRNSLMNSLEFDGSGSTSSYLANLKAGKKLDPASGPLSHAEWNVGYRAEETPSAPNRLRSAVGLAQGDIATRAKGNLGIIFRAGGMGEFGTSSSEFSDQALLADAPQRILKLYAGTTFSHERNMWNASYGFQLGKGTQATPVAYTKHLLDFSHQVRWLVREHWPIQLDSHVNAGWIVGDDNAIPVVERFFGGNRPANFLNNDLWRLPSGPLLRSVPENQLNQSRAGAPVGGTNFVALNFTAAFPVWSYPAMPPGIRYAKPLLDGIHLGLQEVQRESLKDYRARTPLFADALRRADVMLPDLKGLRRHLSDLEKDRSLPEDLKAELKDLIETYIDPAIQSVGEAHKLSNSGLAWSSLHNLSGSDADTNPLAHINDDLLNSVIPALTQQNRGTDASLLRLSAQVIDQHRRDVDALLLKIEPSAVVSPSVLNRFSTDLEHLNQSAMELLELIKPLQGRKAPVGSTAFEAAEWAGSLAANTNPEDAPTDPFDALHVLTRLALGVGKLVPPQIESVASSSDSLAQMISESDPEQAVALRKAVAGLRDELAHLAPRVKALSIPSGERWARQQNSYFVRALDVAFREMNLAAISPVLMFDAARLSPQPVGLSAFRYGIGPGLRFSIVSFQVTLGYSFNPSPRMNEKRGAFAFSMDIVDLFR